MINKHFSVSISSFSGGMANDIRDKDTSKWAFTRNFDTLAYKHRLVPYRSYEAGNDTLSRALSDFMFVNDPNVSVNVLNTLFALGINPSSSNEPKIYSRTTFTDGTWSSTANATADTGDDRVPGCLVYYKGFLFGFAGTTDVFKYDVTGSAVWAHPTTIAHNTDFAVQGVVHPTDDTLYMAGTNIIKKTTDGTTFTAGITLPTNFIITSMCVYGNYLAIACKSTDPISQTSKVFLWDRVATTWNEEIDWGSGSLNVLEELEGKLIGISLTKRETTGGLLFNSVLSVKYYVGAQGAIEFIRLEGTRATDTNPISFLGTQKQKLNNRLYFVAMLSTAEATQTKEGVWSIGRVDHNNPYCIVNEYPSRNDNATVPNAIDGFSRVGSYMFVAYSDSGTLSGNVSKTDDAANFTSNSVYESLIFDGDDSSLQKKLIGVTVQTRALPSGGSVTLKYRIDENISNSAINFNTIFTNTTANSFSHSAINIESTGATLPEFKELQLQIISTGGAEITGLSFEYEITGKRIY